MSQSRCFLGGFLLPHPPVIVPAVGDGREQDASLTCEALEQVAQQFASLRPETVVLISPHAPVFRDFVCFYEPLAGETSLAGSLHQFGDDTVQRYEWDGILQARLLQQINARGIEAGSLDVPNMKRLKISPSLDHGTLVPLHFLSRHYAEFKLIVLASAGIPLQQVYDIGIIIRDEAEKAGRRTLLVASGDLSHKVNDESPYGACPEGGRFDERITGLLSKGDLAGVVSIDHSLREKAAECGFRSVVTLCGALEGLPVTCSLLSYEAPFGIGYGVASLLVSDEGNRLNPEKHPDTSAATDSLHPEFKTAPASLHPNTNATSTPLTQQSPHVRLAKAALEARILHHRHLTVQEAPIAKELLSTRGGVFVSLHKFGELRGCIGTIAATTDSLAEEIIQNAISASTGDPRFDPVTPDELPYLTVHVDVLNPPEACSREMLDPKRYGVIVETSNRRGLLLPDLEGVDTVEDQLDISCRKGGIDPNGSFRISRFTVTRYET